MCAVIDFWSWSQPRVEGVLRCAWQKEWDVVISAIRSGYPVRAVTCESRGCPLPVLDIAAMYGHLPTVFVALQHGANPNASLYFGWTSLHYAVTNFGGSQREIVKTLLAVGADVNAVAVHKPARSVLGMAITFACQQQTRGINVDVRPVLRVLLAQPRLEIDAVVYGETAEQLAIAGNMACVVDMIRAEVCVMWQKLMCCD